jgi:hypothetical protein
VNTEIHDYVLNSDVGDLITSFMNEFDAEVIDAGLALLLNCLPISSNPIIFKIR